MMSPNSNSVLAESLSAYLPIDRRHALKTGATLPDRSVGAVLFADISGFTALTATLAHELGPRRGAEEVTRQLDRVYGALIAQVNQYGGSVVDFSGDAITCWLDGDTGLRAAASALAMQAAMRQFATIHTPGGTPIELAIKVCGTIGSVRRFLVGDPQIHVMEALAGHLLDRIEVAGHLVHKGEVLLAGDIVDAVGAQLKVVEWRNDESTQERFAVIAELLQPVAEQPWSDMPMISGDVARAWILPTVYARLQSGQEKFLAELRPVVALFLKFSGIDYDDDDAAGQKLDAYIRWVQRVVDHYEGTLLQLTMGDKGSYLYAVFGAPLAHENDSDRSVAAALDLLLPPPELSFIKDIHIGISRGQMRTGAYGGPTRRTYGVLGNEVNAAARLMQTAQAGQILVTERIANTATAFEFQAAGRVSLKGLTEPMPIFDVIGKRHEPAQASLPPPLVGREVERHTIAERLRALRDEHTGSVMIIEAEAGLGKSRLVAEIRDQAQALHIQILFGATDPIEQSTAYNAWRAIFNQVLGLEGLTIPATRQARVIEYLQRNSRLNAWVPLLSDMLQLDMPPNEITIQMPSLVQADNLQELLVTLLVSALHHDATVVPRLLILEDAHWLDSSSWVLLNKVVDRIQPLMLVIASRPLSAPVPPEYLLLLERPDQVHLQLEALPDSDVETLVGQRLGVTSLPPAVISFILEKAEGHPFFSEELAFALRDAGLIQIVEGVCHIAPEAQDLHTLDFPATIEGVINSRIDRLLPQHQLALKVASVIGRIFTYHILRDVHPVEVDRSHLLDYLDALTRLDITRMNAPEPEMAYMFKHIITQEVAYNLMLFTQREQLHRAVAEWYEHQYTAELSSYYSLLAYHWQRAAEDKQAPPWVQFKAIDYLDQAGEQALRSSAYKEAIELFRQAFALEPSDSIADKRRLAYLAPVPLPLDVRRQANRYLKLGEAQRNWGHLGEGRKSFERAVALYGYPLPSSTRSLIGRLLVQILRQIMHRLRPAHYLGRAPEDRRSISINTARAYQYMSEVFYFTSEGLLSLYSTFLSLNLCELAGTSPELAEAYSVMGILTDSLGLHRQAHAHAQRAIATAKATGQTMPLAYVLSMNSLSLLENGHWDQAQENLTQALGILDELGNKRRWGDAMAMLASVAAFRGDLMRATQLFDEIVGPRTGTLVHRTTSAVWRGRVALLQGRFDEAIALLQSALDLTADSTDAFTMVHTQIHAWGFLAMVYLRQNRWQLVRQAADTAMQLITESKAAAYQVNISMAYVIEVYLMYCARANDLSPAERQQMMTTVQKLCRAMRATPGSGRLRAWRCQGLYDWQLGKVAAARKAWQKSLMMAEQLQMPYEQAQAHYDIGFHLVPSDPAREQHLRRARELFSQIGAAYDLAQAEAALAQSSMATGAAPSA